MILCSVWPAFGEAVNGTAGVSQPVTLLQRFTDGLPVDDRDLDSNYDRLFSWTTAHLASGQGGQFAHNQDLAKDSSTSASMQSASSLTWGYKSGRIELQYDTGSVFITVASGTITLMDTATNFIEFNIDSMAVQSRATKFTDTFVHMYIVRRDSSQIYGETDARTWITNVQLLNTPRMILNTTYAGRPTSGLRRGKDFLLATDTNALYYAISDTDFITTAAGGFTVPTAPDTYERKLFLVDTSQFNYSVNNNEISTIFNFSSLTDTGKFIVYTGDYTCSPLGGLTAGNRYDISVTGGKSGTYYDSFATMAQDFQDLGGGIRPPIKCQVAFVTPYESIETFTLKNNNNNSLLIFNNMKVRVFK